jgi:hypothetical protein
VPLHVSFATAHTSQWGICNAGQPILPSFLQLQRRMCYQTATPVSFSAMFSQSIADFFLQSIVAHGNDRFEARALRGDSA